jgi:hypothetical protein
MPVVNMRGYDSKPLEMEFERHTVTSPVPDAENLKLMKAITEYSAVTAVVGQAAAKAGEDVQAAIKQIDTPEVMLENADVDITVLALGGEETARLREAGCPEPLIEKAAMYALLYWATGEDTSAGNAWLEQVEDTRNPKAPRPPRRRDQKGKKRRRR